MTDIANLTAYK